FQHLAEMDSSFAPALEHPTETATWRKDRALFERSFASFAAHASAFEKRRHGLLGRIAFGNPDSILAAFTEVLRPPADLNHGSEIGYPVWTLTGTILRSPKVSPAMFLDASDTLWTMLRRTPPTGE